MKVETISTKTKGKNLIRLCHICGEIIEATSEPLKCPRCKKNFLPSNYFGKVHAKNSSEFQELFSSVDELVENDLIKGLATIW